MARYRPIPPNARGFARPAGEGEIAPEIARQVRAALDEAGSRPAPQLGLPVLRFGIASRALPEGALAMVIREGSSSDVVFSGATLDDGVYMIVDHLVWQDLEDHPAPVSRRVLTLQTLHTVLVRTDTGSETRTIDLEFPARGQYYITGRLLDAAARQAASHVPQVGDVRFVAEE